MGFSRTTAKRLLPSFRIQKRQSCVRGDRAGNFRSAYQKRQATLKLTSDVASGGSALSARGPCQNPLSTPGKEKRQKDLRKVVRIAAGVSTAARGARQRRRITIRTKRGDVHPITRPVADLGVGRVGGQREAAARAERRRHVDGGGEGAARAARGTCRGGEGGPRWVLRAQGEHAPWAAGRNNRRRRTHQ